MNDSYEFLKMVINTLTDSIVVIDRTGNILFVNQSWINFGNANHCVIGNSWLNCNYLEACDKSAKMGDNFGYEASKGIRQVINSKRKLFYFEYPCHSPDEQRWFMMRVTPFILNDTNYYVISHQNITKRKLAEQKAIGLSRIDGLTGIPNRRYFDEFLSEEWKRCARLKMPVTLAIIDVDHFKLFNDTYGHQKGDDCLKVLAETIKKYAKRPSDICARYGGEEFAIVHGNNTLLESKPHFDDLLRTVRELKIPNIDSPIESVVTISIGLSTMEPDGVNSEVELVKKADELLYEAKMSGRNRLVI